MPIILPWLIIGAIGGAFFINGTSNTITLTEGLVAGAVIGIGAAAVFYAYKKV